LIRHRSLFALLAVVAISAVCALVLPRAIGVAVLVLDLIAAFGVLLWLLGTDAWRDALARRRAERASARAEAD